MCTASRLTALLVRLTAGSQRRPRLRCARPAINNPLYNRCCYTLIAMNTSASALARVAHGGWMWTVVQTHARQAHSRMFNVSLPLSEPHMLGSKAYVGEKHIYCSRDTRANKTNCHAGHLTRGVGRAPANDSRHIEKSGATPYSQIAPRYHPQKLTNKYMPSYSRGHSKHHPRKYKATSPFEKVAEADESGKTSKLQMRGRWGGRERRWRFVRCCHPRRRGVSFKPVN